MIFSAVMLAIALLGVSGFAGIQAVEDHHRSSNAEQAMLALSSNVDDLQRYGAPSRSTEIRLADAGLRMEGSTVVNVSFTNGETITVRPTPVVFEADRSTTLRYATGAVIREDDGHAVMVQEPSFVISEETLILPLDETDASNAQPISGTTAVHVEKTTTGVDVIRAADGLEGPVTVEITSPYATAWERYLDEHAERDCSVTDPETVSCELHPETVVVTVTSVDVEFR